jgi:hypothetical protein
MAGDPQASASDWWSQLRPAYRCTLTAFTDSRRSSEATTNLAIRLAKPRSASGCAGQRNSLTLPPLLHQVESVSSNVNRP